MGLDFGDSQTVLTIARQNTNDNKAEKFDFRSISLMTALLQIGFSKYIIGENAIHKSIEMKGLELNFKKTPKQKPTFSGLNRKERQKILDDIQVWTSSQGKIELFLKKFLTAFS